MQSKPQNFASDGCPARLHGTRMLQTMQRELAEAPSEHRETILASVIVALVLTFVADAHEPDAAATMLRRTIEYGLNVQKVLH